MCTTYSHSVRLEEDTVGFSAEFIGDYSCDYEIL